jgi:hypothetical protein
MAPPSDNGNKKTPNYAIVEGFGQHANPFALQDIRHWMPANRP